MKVCDAADWFAPELASIIASELHQIPRLHRKQWEFATKLSQLAKAGVLRADACGISFGTGREALLYALANRVGHIWATDLYSAGTIWPHARTTDINQFVRGNPPFPTNVERISTKNMDMRQIEFADETFDFAYSSSAVEHIGSWDDFRQHLAEVRRVLKPGGVYVMTTDICYDGPITEPGNFKFDAEGLQWWLQESGMSYDPVIDCRIAKHHINTPLPADLMHYITPDECPEQENLFNWLVQVQMVVGRHPHSSVVLEMKKAPTDRPQVAFPGLAETTAFLHDRLNWWQGFVETTDLYPHPAPWVPAELREQMWATTYAWLGNRPRTVKVRIQTDRPGRVTIGVNKGHTDSYWVPVVDIPARIETTTGLIEFELTVSCDRDWIYAVYGNALDDTKLVDVSVIVRDARFVATTPIITQDVAAADEPVQPVVSRQDVAETVAQRGSLSILASAVNRILRPARIQVVRTQSLSRLLEASRAANDSDR